MVKYLIDSNCLIEAYRRYYNFDIVPSFWHQFKRTYDQSVFLLDKVKNEICLQTDPIKKDELQLWLEQNCLIGGKVISCTKNQAVIDQYQIILQYVYNAPHYRESSFREWALSMDKADPWLIAVASIDNYTIVTLETRDSNLSANNPTRKEPKIPDVCDYFGVECINLFDFMRRENCII